MNPTLKTVLNSAPAKNAVNAALTALGPVAAWHSQFYFSNWHGLKHIALVMGSAVVAREIMVYGPKLLAWSSTPDVPVSEQGKP